jgi:hypothetical protein
LPIPPIEFVAALAALARGFVHQQSLDPDALSVASVETVFRSLAGPAPE